MATEDQTIKGLERTRRARIVVDAVRALTPIDSPPETVHALICALLYLAWYHSDHPAASLAHVRDEIQRAIDLMPQAIAALGAEKRGTS